MKYMFWVAHLTCLVSSAIDANNVTQNTSSVKGNNETNNQNNTTKTMGDKNILPHNNMTTTTANSSATNGSSTTPSILKHIRFQDNWKVEYPVCSPSNNKFLSPININTTEVINIGKYLRTLQVYAYEPIKSYYLQTWYNDTENNITMSALTITMDDKIFFEAAYINGLGFWKFLLFQRAVFFFSKKRLSHGECSHRINGKSYPMEIMLTFTNRKPDNETIKNSVQIFILVDIQPNDNPNFFPVIQAAKEILKMKSKSQTLKNLTTTLDLLTQNLTTLTQLYKRSGKGGEVGKLKPLMERIKRAVIGLKKNEKQRIGVSHLLNGTKRLLSSTAYSTKYKNMTIMLSMARNEYQSALQQDRQDKGLPWTFLEEKRALEERVVEISNVRNAYAGALTVVANDINYFNKMLDTLKSKDQDYMRFIKNAINQIQGVDKPTNGTLVIKFYQKQIKLFNEIQEIQKKINLTKNQIQKTNKSFGWKHQLGTFQITWLLPDRGGVYLYNGSNPLPPCQRVRYSVVLKNPVGISKEQFETLTSIPAYEGYESVGEEAVPPFPELGTRLVWYNAKNIQWQRDDGIHMKSIIRRKFKTDFLKKKMKGAGSPRQNLLEEILILIIPYLYFINCF